ncbi:MULTISPECIES: response regulator [Mesorhizobium]|uniref:response regulator n=1 Tax=Mesorhizobium TaxID=68287 RepID=UPI0024830D4B|nr:MULTISPECIES: response regulator [Mesorhizobium]
MLVVEDEALVAMLIEDMLMELGYEVLGPAMRLEPALMAPDENFDVALLDVNLANEQSFPVAQLLRERGIPFVFATGYGLRGLDERLREVMTLQKPFEPHQLADAISFVLASE